MAWSTITAKAAGSRLYCQDHNRLADNCAYLYSGFDVGHDVGTGAHSIKLSDLLPTTSAELRSVLSDETGTGSAVFSDSPTFGTKITTPKVESADDLTIVCGAGKTLVLSAGAWDDLMVNVTGARLPSSGNPSWIAAATTGWSCELLEFSKSATNTIYFTVQMPHGYAVGTDICCHVHWASQAAKTVAEGVRVMWSLALRWTDIGEDRGAEVTRTNYLPVQMRSGSTYTAADIVANRHYLTDFTVVATGASGGVVSGAGMTLSSVLAGSLSRVGGDATYDTYDDEVYLLGIDFHYQKDTLGSRAELAK